ncbi:Chromosome segregation ATPase, partial [Giardia duodenalis]
VNDSFTQLHLHMGVWGYMPLCVPMWNGGIGASTRRPRGKSRLLQHICRVYASATHMSPQGNIMTRRIQCGGATLEIDPLTGELTLDDFLNTLPPPHMEPMQTPKVELGASFGVFGIPFIDNLLGDIYGQLDLIAADMEKFIAYLQKKTLDAINWGLVLAGVQTASQAIPIIINEISKLVFRWKAFHQWEKEQKKENQPQDIPDEEIEKKEEISELSGEDQEPPSLGEVEEPLFDMSSIYPC